MSNHSRLAAPILAFWLIACAHDRSSGDWFEDRTPEEKEATTLAIQTLGGLGGGALVSGTAAGVIAIFERNNGCLEGECVSPFVLTVGAAVVAELAIGALFWGIGKARSGRGKIGPSLAGSIIAGALMGAGMIALLSSDDDLSAPAMMDPAR